jgi:hypothetical protein
VLLIVGVFGGCSRKATTAALQAVEGNQIAAEMPRIHRATPELDRSAFDDRSSPSKRNVGWDFRPSIRRRRVDDPVASARLAGEAYVTRPLLRTNRPNREWDAY